MWADNFSTTYSYGLSDWSLTNYTDQSSYYQVPSGNDPSVATISGIFTGKTITSNVVVTINCATYGNGTNPSASTFSLYKETACTNAITAAQGGTLPSSSTYTNVTYTITQAYAASLGDDLAIKITKPGKTIRLKSIKVEFTYSGGTKYTVNVANDIANGSVTASPTSAAAGVTVTLTATPNTGYEFGSWNVTDVSSNAIAVTNNKFTMPASDVNVSATFNKDAGTTYNFADMTDFSSWGTSYEKKTTTFSDGAYVELATANKSTSTVTDCPITKGGDVIFKAPTGKKISSLTFTCTQWNTKAQTITLNTSSNGTDYTATSTTSSNFVLSASNLTDVSAVKFTFSSASNQVGIKSIKVTYADDGGDTPEKTITALEVSGTPTKTTYNVGDAFDPAGLVVTATYSDDTQEVISTGFEWEIDYGKTGEVSNEALVAGATSVDVMVYTEDQEVMSEVYTVNGLTVTVPVTLTSIAVSGTPNKTEYYVGDAFETAGLVVTGTYSDSHQETITEGIELTVDPETLTLGITSVDVMASVGEVDSEVYTVEGLTVTKAPFETVTYNFSSFTSGQSVELTDLDGFTITLKGNGGTNPAWSSNQARVYAKGSLTVSANNATIKSIEYIYVVNANKNDVVPTIDGVAGTTNAGTWDVENKTWTGADEEVTFSTSGTAGNIGFTKLIIKYVESNKITPTLSFSAPTAEVTIGVDDNVFPTLTTTPADLEGVTYESSNTDVATIDENTGVVTLVAAGETTITASYAGNEDYKAATPASYTLTVVKAPFVPTPAPEGYEVVDFTEIYSSDANVEDYEGTSFAMTFAKPQRSSTTTKYYSRGNAVRAYEGNTITITAAENIKYVDIAWADTYVDDAVSITGLGTTTAVVTFSKTCRFTKITVSYAGSNSTLVATDGENYYDTFSSEKNVVFANATAYTVSVEGDVLALTEVARNKVPADNAVLIKSATANVNYYFVDGDENFEDNKLAPCPTTGIFKEEADGNYYYKLAYGDNNNKTKLGFWWGANDGSGNFNVKASGAVLVVPQSQAGSNLRGFSFDYEDTLTGLDALEIANDSVIYNIQGQRITRVQQGVNIVNGKKVIR